MLAPFMILFFLFTILPILTSLVLSFFNYDMVSAPSFVWIENFKRMFLEDSVFLISVRNTLYISVIAGPIGFVLAFILPGSSTSSTPCPGAAGLLSIRRP